MKEKFIKSSLKFINKYETCDELKTIKLKYGLEAIYNLIVKSIIIILIAYIFNTFIETLLIMLFYSGIRTFSYGLHAKSNIACWITTIIIYNIIPLLITKVALPNYIGYIILIIGLISMLLWAPADTPKKPLIRPKNRHLCKVLSVIVIILYSTIYLINDNEILNNALLYGILIQIIMINPLTYKITKTKFNNYKYYHKKELTTV